jgi:hypothetical protein
VGCTTITTLPPYHSTSDQSRSSSAIWKKNEMAASQAVLSIYLSRQSNHRNDQRFRSHHCSTPPCTTRCHPARRSALVFVFASASAWSSLCTASSIILFGCLSLSLSLLPLQHIGGKLVHSKPAHHTSSQKTVRVPHLQARRRGR